MGKLMKNEKLVQEIRSLVDQGKKQVTQAVNASIAFTYWHIGNLINKDILNHQRAEYGKQVIEGIAQELVKDYGKSFEVKNLRRMMQFADVFPDIEIVAPLVRQLSWSHFLIIIPIKDEQKRQYYLEKSAQEGWSKRMLRAQIEKKAYERNEIANLKYELTETGLKDNFKDPYVLEFLGLKDGYLENDLESAIIKELEHFILELGKGFAFLERQKRMIIDGEDFYLDLLFYHRKLRRLVAIELKLGKFKAAYKGQMELYLRWLDQNEKQDHENTPIGLILCAEAGAEQVELLNMPKDGIMVAEYWTDLPPKKLIEEKLHQAILEAKERLINQTKNKE